MSKKMNARDKKLLYIMLIAIVVFVSIYYIIMPLNDKREELEQQLSAAQLEKEQVDTKISTLPMMRAAANRAIEKYDELIKDFYPLMESQEIDRVMTSLALENGLFAEALTIGLPVSYSTISPYVNSVAAKSWLSSDELSGFYSANLTFRLSASPEKLMDFLDFLGEQNSIRVVSVSWNYVTEDSSAARFDEHGNSLTSEDNSTLNLILDFYMFETYNRGV